MTVKMAKFSKSLDIDDELVAVIDKNNSVLVEGHHVGRLEGFSFVNEVSNNQQDKKEVLKIVRRTLYKELKIRVANFQNCKDSEISFDKMMNIYWKKVEGGATSEFAEIEDYIDETITVWYPNPRKKDEHWIYPG